MLVALTERPYPEPDADRAPRAVRPVPAALVALLKRYVKKAVQVLYLCPVRGPRSKYPHALSGRINRGTNLV